MLRSKKGQSILEYITVFTAIVAVIVLIAYTKMRPSVERVFDASANRLSSSANEFDTNTAP